MAQMSAPRNTPNCPESGEPGPETPQQSMTAGEFGVRADGGAVVFRGWKVGHRTVTLTIPRPQPGTPVFATAEWEPDEPSRLSDQEWREYRLGRHNALVELSAELGLSIGLLEL